MQVFTPPALPSRATLELAHAAEYVGAFLEGALDDARLRRIGFGAATNTQVLRERTLAEVAGAPLAGGPGGHAGRARW